VEELPIISEQERYPMKEVSLLELLKSGAHFGHTTSRWNPKMKPYIFTTRSGMHILDLEKTKKGLIEATRDLERLASQGGVVLFVGTKKQSREIVKQAAIACGMPFVNIRWLGGTFTNFKTIQKTIRKLEKLEELKLSGEIDRYTKKERLMIEREIEKLKKLFEGIKNMKRLPEAIFIADVKHDAIALKEANKAKVTTIGIVDSNCSPEGVGIVIPSNDDSAKATELIVNALAEAVNQGKQNIQTAEIKPAA